MDPMITTEIVLSVQRSSVGFLKLLLPEFIPCAKQAYLWLDALEMTRNPWSKQ